MGGLRQGRSGGSGFLAEGQGGTGGTDQGVSGGSGVLAESQGGAGCAGGPGQPDSSGGQGRDDSSGDPLPPPKIFLRAAVGLCSGTGPDTGTIRQFGRPGRRRQFRGPTAPSQNFIEGSCGVMLRNRYWLGNRNRHRLGNRHRNRNGNRHRNRNRNRHRLGGGHLVRRHRVGGGHLVRRHRVGRRDVNSLWIGRHDVNSLWIGRRDMNSLWIYRTWSSGTTRPRKAFLLILRFPEQSCAAASWATNGGAAASSAATG
ncbi:hypothetical protein PO909_024932 [Leuciscus waleckii]